MLNNDPCANEIALNINSTITALNSLPEMNYERKMEHAEAIARSNFPSTWKVMRGCFYDTVVVRDPNYDGNWNEDVVLCWAPCEYDDDGTILSGEWYAA